MRTVKFDARALITLSLLLPAMAMAAQDMPHPGPVQDLHMLNPAAPGESAKADQPAPAAIAVDAVATQIVSQPPDARPEESAGMGAALAMDQLEIYRGGSEISNSSVSNGLLQDTTAINVMTGKNSITDGAFAHVSGLPIVIQNSGPNVLIQNSTIVNVEFK